MAKAVGKKMDIGLDLTSDELRVVALSRQGKDFVLEKFAIGKIPSSVFAAGKVAEPRELGARIREILAANGIVPKRALVSLSGKSSITRIVEFPRMGVAQTRQAIHLQINQFVPFPPTDTVFDFKILPPGSNPNPAMQDILLVATRQSTVQSFVDTLRAAGIEPGGIKITSLAAGQMVLSKIEQTYQQSICLVDLRDSVTDLTFFLRGNFRMSRAVELGYNSIVAKISQMLGISLAEAEEYLTTERIDLCLPEEEIDPNEDNRLREAVLSIFSTFVSELIRSIRYYESQAQRQERVGRLYIFGNIQLFENLAKYLEEQTGLEVRVVSLPSLVGLKQGVYSIDILNQNSEKLVVAAGLAAELITKKKIELNLLPAAFYVKAQTFTVLRIGFALLVVLAGLGYFYYVQQAQALEQQRNEYNAAVQESKKWQADSAQFVKEREAIKTDQPKFHQVINLIRKQRVWPLIMDELGRVTPDRVVVAGVVFQAATNSITITGKVGRRQDLMEFAILLDSNPFFSGTVVGEQSESSKGGGAGGVGGGRGGGPGGPIGVHGSRPPDVGDGSLFSGVYKPSEGDSAPEDYEFPKYGGRAGANIEDFFGPQISQILPITYKFKIDVKLEPRVVEQAEAVKDLDALDKVIENVVKS
jgi:type IV pilus assembly protein PilM